jgi:hypothetical protein
LGLNFFFQNESQNLVSDSWLPSPVATRRRTTAGRATSQIIAALPAGVGVAKVPCPPCISVASPVD